MKPPRLRARLPVQNDLFERATSAPLTGLQLGHDELVDLISRLLWEVVSDADVSRSAESSDEQDHH